MSDGMVSVSEVISVLTHVMGSHPYEEGDTLRILAHLDAIGQVFEEFARREKQEEDNDA